MSIAENLDKILHSLKLVAVSKTKPIPELQEAYNAGQRIFGENKAQELQQKAQALPNDIQWHMIGHLQRNKVKYLAPHVSLIHSVDSLRLLAEINKRAEQNDRIIPVLLQVYIAKEESKFGLDEDEIAELLQSESFKNMQHITVHGLMGMATNTENKETIRREFQSLSHLFKQLKAEYFAEQESFQEISMGMSGDYEIAMEEGATLVRVGSAIFGARNYK